MKPIRFPSFRAAIFAALSIFLNTGTTRAHETAQRPQSFCLVGALQTRARLLGDFCRIIADGSVELPPPIGRGG